MSEAWRTIKHIAEQGNGQITPGLAAASGVSRTTLSALTDKGMLVRVSRGVYTLADTITDEYALLQSHCGKAVFSLGTALYFWGLSDRVPHQIDMTVPQGTNISRVRTASGKLRCHYVKSELHPLGITTTISPMGSEIRLYDKERCICDLIRSRNSTDKQLYTQAIKDYFTGKPNTRKLIKYSKALGVEDRVRAYMEVLL